MIKIFEDLQELNLPVYLEGEAPEELPDEYYTFSEDYTSDNLNADNETKEILYEFTLKFYSKDSERIYDGILEAIALLKKKDYIVGGVGYSSPQYKDWKCREVDVEKIEYLD